MKKLMILGASYSLNPLIEAAKRMGYYTIVTSIPGDYPGFELGDEVCYADITDPEQVLEAAKRLKIDGIATCCMDVGLKSQGYVCSAMNLPGPSWEAVQRCTDKWKMKEAFAANGVHTAAFRQITCPEDLENAMRELRFPLMVKAVDQMGSRGIFRCDTPDEVRRYYPMTMAASRKPYCVLEEYLEGTMFGVEAMLQNGKVVMLLPDGHVVHESNPPFPIGHIVPWEEGFPYQEKIEAEVYKAIKAFGADNCPMDCDMMLCGDEVYIIEATARAGATGLAELIGLHYDCCYYEAIVSNAMGLDVSHYFALEKDKRQAAISRLLESYENGIVRCIDVSQVPREGLFDLSFNIEEGSEVEIMRGGRDRIGQAILSAPTPADCYKRMDEVLKGIHLTVTEKNEKP